MYLAILLIDIFAVIPSTSNDLNIGLTGLYWVLIKVIALFISLLNIFLVVFLLKKEKQEVSERDKRASIFISKMIEIRYKQLRQLAYTFIIAAVLELGVLLWITYSNFDTADCYPVCSVPINENTGTALLFNTLVMLFPQMYTWYVFYYLPKSFST